MFYLQVNNLNLRRINKKNKKLIKRINNILMILLNNLILKIKMIYNLIGSKIYNSKKIKNKT